MESEIEALLGRPVTDQERDAIIQPLLGRGVTVQGVVEALRATETPVRQLADEELRTIRFEAVGGEVARIPD